MNHRTYRMLSVILLLAFSISVFAFAEEEMPAAKIKMQPADLMQLYAPYVLCVKDGEEKPPVEVDENGQPQQRRTYQYGLESWRMGVLVSDSIVMYPFNLRMRQYRKTRIQPDEELKATVALPDGKKIAGVEIGMNIDKGYVFTMVSIPEDATAVKLEWDKIPDINIGDKVYIICRLGDEWDFAPFYLPAEINGEMKFKGEKIFRLTLSQMQLNAEAIGGLVVRDDGKVLGIISRINGKRYSIAVVPLASFKKIADKAINNPEELNQFDDLPEMRRGMPGQPGRMQPGGRFGGRIGGGGN